MMKTVRSLVVTMVIGVLLSAVALADSKSHSVTFNRDVKLNGTLIEKGTYKVVFDEQANELMILKGKETVAKATARAEKREKKAEATEIRTSIKGGDVELTGLAFRGDYETIVVSGSGSMSSGSN